MKFVISICIIFTIVACKTKESSLMYNLSNKSEQLKIDDCPKGFSCNVEVLKNKTYTIETDSMGKIYPKIVDGENIVIKYTYSVDNPKNYADGNQSETLHFIIHKNTESLWKDEGLKNIKLLFGKNCFCRDIFGFYKVNKGSFIIKKKKGKTEVEIEFTIPKLGERQFLRKVKFLMD